MAPTIELYFDYTCPFAYLASTQARALAARTGAELVWKPILLGGVFRAQGTPQALSETLGPAKTAHNLADMQRWAARYGVPLRMPEGHPLRSVEALRATIATGIDPKVIEGFYRAYWVEGRPISEPSVVREVLAAAGHDPDTDVSKAKDDLRARTDEAIARGVFGVPTFIVEGELIWGQDRIPFVEARARRAKRRTLDVYWDFSSPFAYLGCSQVSALAARTGAEVRWHPILLGGLFRSIGMPEVPLATFSPKKQEHVARDLERWAAHWGVPYRFPSRFPTRSLDALRLWFALPAERRDAFRDAVFRAYWAEDRDIADAEVLASCIGDAAIAAEARERAKGDDVKAALRASTEAAAARGVFGVPTFVVDEKDLYWGQDRLGLVEEALTSA